MTDLPFIVEPGSGMVWAKPFARPFPGTEGGLCASAEGLLPIGTAIGAGTGKPSRLAGPSVFIDKFSAPPVPAYSGQSHAGVRGCNPGAVSAPLTEQVPHLRAESVRVPENRDDTSRGDGCPPTHTPPNEIGAGTHKTIPARAPRIFIESHTARPVTRTSRTIMRAGSGGEKPRREDGGKRMDHARIRKSDDF